MQPDGSIRSAPVPLSWPEPLDLGTHCMFRIVGCRRNLARRQAVQKMPGNLRLAACQIKGFCQHLRDVRRPLKIQSHDQQTGPVPPCPSWRAAIVRLPRYQMARLGPGPQNSRCQHFDRLFVQLVDHPVQHLTRLTGDLCMQVRQRPGSGHPDLRRLAGCPQQSVFGYRQINPLDRRTLSRMSVCGTRHSIFSNILWAWVKCWCRLASGPACSRSPLASNPSDRASPRSYATVSCKWRDHRSRNVSNCAGLITDS